MTTLTIGLIAGAAVLVLLAVVAAFLESRTRRRLGAALAASQHDVSDLRARLDALEGLDTLAGARYSTNGRADSTNGRADSSDGQEYVITSMGVPAPVEAAPATLTAPAFADAVVRESVVHAASFLYGVRRALSPEVRNRIRFEMKREAKRARKDRRAEVKEALREYRARHRADVPSDIETVA